MTRALLDLLAFLAYGALTGGMGWVLHARVQDQRFRRIAARTERMQR